MRANCLVSTGAETFLHAFGMTDDRALAPIDVHHLPLQVGNCFGSETKPVVANQTCLIAVRGEADLSAPHFEILRRDGELGVRDLRSRFGTIDNGVVITRTSLDNLVLPHPGANDVIAGRSNSPFRFRVPVREAQLAD
jgi:hypothetical protein